LGSRKAHPYDTKILQEGRQYLIGG
jgi:hypothetical protein